MYGRYETLFRIAAGGMAEVYAARVRGEAGFQKLVALKRMLPHLTDDERFVSMFMDEGKLAANISSPNVVSTLDLGRADDGSLYLVMELVVGTTMSGLLRNVARSQEQIPIDVAVELLAQAAQGLHDAHEAKTPFGAPLQIVHRDISPQNILVGVDGRVWITDFGVARAILRRTKTSTGEFKGKLSYFSPEQCADKPLDRRSDIFSLGVVAWETLTTRRLFHAENPLAVLERVTRMPIPSAHVVNPDVPVAVAAVVAMALERDRDQRFATSADFAVALRNAARDTVGSADRQRVSDLVEQHGGETLDRMQRQLKASLSSPGIPQSEPIEEAKTEVSSGIIFRDGDGAPIPATPKPPAVPAGAQRADASRGAPRSAPVDEPPHATASFVGDPRAIARPASSSRVPLVIASLVAVLGLGAGAGIGVLASTSGEELPPLETLPPEAPTSALPVLGAETELVAADPPEAPAVAPVAPPEAAGRGPRRRGARGAGEALTEPLAAAPTATVPPPVVAAEPVAPAATQPPAQARVVRRPTPVVTPRPSAFGSSPYGSSAGTQPPPQTTSPPQRRGGLVGLDGFDSDINRN